MSYSNHPIHIPTFFKDGTPSDCKGPIAVDTNIGSPCVTKGYNRPLNEKCTIITDSISKGPTESFNSVWNSMTKRKSVVKDYK